MKPLLAEPVDFKKLAFPVLASPKYDGFRCLIHPSLGPVTRSLKPLANNYVRGKLAEFKIPYLDGELLTLTGNRIDDFNTVQSKLSTRSGMPDFCYMVFDHFQHPTKPFTIRHGYYVEAVSNLDNPRVEVTYQHLIRDEEELLEYEHRQLELGWEGVMIRSRDGYYKFGRSTTNEGILLKLKRFKEDEGIIVGQYEKLHNSNEATTNELGYTERSSHKENMVPMGVLGGFTVLWRGVEFDLGSGFNDKQREEYWRENNDGKKVTFKYQDIGPNGKPRFPIFRGIRHDLN